MLEVYSHGDLYKAHEPGSAAKGQPRRFEERRVRMQGSLWMAMALWTDRAAIRVLVVVAAENEI